MKRYNITFQVPDDFDPEKMELTASYPEKDILILNEGFEDSESYIDAIKNSLSNSDFCKKKDSDFVVIKIPTSLDLSQEEMQFLLKNVEQVTELPAIVLLDDIDLFVENADAGIKMLEGMIAKIKVRSAVKDTSGIVLPN